MADQAPRTIELDIRGQICPSTLLVTLREVNNNIDALMSGTTRLSVTTDNRDCTNTIPEAVGNMGLQAEINKNGSHYTILIFK